MCEISGIAVFRGYSCLDKKYSYALNLPKLIVPYQFFSPVPMALPPKMAKISRRIPHYRKQ